MPETTEQLLIYREYNMIHDMRHIGNRLKMPGYLAVKKLFCVVCIEASLLYEDLRYWRPNGYS